MCSLFVKHEDLRESFARYLLDDAWISSYLEDILQNSSTNRHDNLISYLLPSGGHLYVNDKRSNTYQGYAFRTTFDKQLSSSRSTRSTVSLSTSTHSNSSCHQEALRLRSPLMVLAVAIRMFSHSLEMKNWQQRLEAQRQLTLKQKPTLKPTPVRYLSKISPKTIGTTQRFFSSTPVLPVEEDDNDQEKSTLRMNLEEEEEEVFYHASINSSSRPPSPAPSACSSAASASESEMVVYPFSYEEEEEVEDCCPSQRSSLAYLTSNPEPACATGTICPVTSLASISPIDGTIESRADQEGTKSSLTENSRVTHFRQFLMSSIRKLVSESDSVDVRFSASNRSVSGRSVSPTNGEIISAHFSSSVDSLPALNDCSSLTKITELLSSKQWLQSLVQYLSEECPVAMTLSEPPVSTLSLENRCPVTSECVVGENDDPFYNSSKKWTLPVFKRSNGSLKTMSYSVGCFPEMETPRLPASCYQNANDFTYVFANAAFANITQMPIESITGETMQLFMHESCTETLQLSLLEDAQAEQVPVRLAMTMYHPRKQQKQLHCIAQQPIVSAKGTCQYSLAVHYPLPACGLLHCGHWSEDLQDVEVFTQLMSSLLV